MTSSLLLSSYTIVNRTIRLYAPDQQQVKNSFQQQNKSVAADAPYWARVWASSIAMAIFIEKNPQLVLNKKVLELAAGLGLPSLVAAPYAKEVCCSDYLQDALDVIDKSIDLNQLSNIQCSIINWHYIPEEIHADVLLLSDINYEPEEFETLFNVLKKFIQQGTSVILTTPQRLMAKPFIERLLDWVTLQEEIIVEENMNNVPISVFVLEAV
jgi:predicted nicotinamide N-methyase